MKITRNQLRRLIKEELVKLEEYGYGNRPPATQRHIEDTARAYYDIYGEDIFLPDFLDNTWGPGYSEAVEDNPRDGKKYLMQRDDLLAAFEKYRR